MAHTGYLPLIHAEIDGELDGSQRAELSRRLLADPEARALREDFRRLCGALDAMPEIEPPPELRAGILAALPALPVAARAPAAPPRQPWASAHRWRYAAVLAGALAAGTVLFVTVEGPRPATSDTAGTMAAARAATTLDTVSLANGPIAGRVSLYRDASGLGLKFELATSAPVDVLVASDGYTIRIKDLGGKAATGEPGTTVALPGFKATGQAVNLTFLVAGREVANATLTAHESR
jgi:hypothetical protein